MESIAEIKSGLHYYIAKTDNPDTLSKLRNFVAEVLSKEESIVAYTSKGVALNQLAYKADIDAAIKEAKNGNTVSIEELEKSL